MLCHINRRSFLKSAFVSAVMGPGLFAMANKPSVKSPANPNIILIYADDVGFGDLACYGGLAPTPNIDRLAQQGLKFNHAYATSATCTPSRYSMLTGQYAWRKEGTGILPGDAGLIIDTETTTLPSMLQKAGYRTGVVGKWHLGLGAKGHTVDWNNQIKPGPNEIGFDYSFLMPATGDRVPCVYTENGRVVNLDPSDPITVNYDKPIAGEPTGITHRDQLKMDWDHGHNNAVVNGVGRIGFMLGGKSAIWNDEDMADTFTQKGIGFIEESKDRPFFLYFATHDIHVPRIPHPRFVGSTTMGPRGDAIVQFDWCVGEILKTLDRLGLAENTLVILTSDNGPVLNDGYKDKAVELVGEHKPAGPLRGGKYSSFEGGTREPFVVRWPGKITPGVTDAYISQIDLFASFAALAGQELSTDDAPDSMNMLDALLGKGSTGRPYVIEHAGGLSLIEGNWKYIEPGKGSKVAGATGNETGNDPNPQLYNIKDDIGEKNNVASKHPQIVRRMASKLNNIRQSGRSRDI